jgi:SAM-dependent methyltransferase
LLSRGSVTIGPVTVLDRIGNEAGRLGDVLSIDFLRYNRIVIRKFDTMARADAPRIVASLRAQFPDAHRVIDVGAGSCAYAAEAARQGLHVTAIERSRHGRRHGKAYGVETQAFDLNDTPPARVSAPFDLAYCFEVAEHLPPSLGDRLVKYLCILAPVVVFTAASPGQGGTGHINEQPAEYWTQRFASAGYEAIPFRLVTEGLSPHWGITNQLAFQSASSSVK